MRWQRLLPLSLFLLEKVTIFGLGTFEVRERAARTGHNPRTGEAVEIAAKRIPAFKAAKALKDAVES